MPVTLHVAHANEIEALVPLLLAADEDEARIRATLADKMHTTYAARDGAQLIGAATMLWREDESEIVYIAVAATARTRGYGKAIIAALLDEARQRAARSVLVGTANSSLDTIAFYQKCGFRMDHVRRDYFDYIQPAISERGILMRDMLVLRYAL
ncbi:MAG: GNAT family N-acetyltransferase [Chloroflexota bacterium]|nr:GNAT family N-acetyltransferase [Chloroflexota bacterium]